MIQVVDQNGIVIEGVYRDRYGALVVDNKSQLEVAKQQKIHSETLDKNIKSLEQQQNKTDNSIDALSEEIQQVKILLQQLVATIDRDLPIK